LPVSVAQRMASVPCEDPVRSRPLLRRTLPVSGSGEGMASWSFASVSTRLATWNALMNCGGESRGRPDWRELRRRLRPDRPRRHPAQRSPRPRPAPPNAHRADRARDRRARARRPSQPQPRRPDRHPRPRYHHSQRHHVLHRRPRRRTRGYIRKVQRYGQTLPEGSYGRRNRQAIAARETRIAGRLRAVEQAYRTAIERDTAFRPPEPTTTCRSPESALDKEIEPE
jgi:hypothetical protein